MGIDKTLLNMTKGVLDKEAFTPPPEYQAQMMGMGPGAPMGAMGMMGGMPPGMPPGGMAGGPGMGMDPSMMSGGMPMDPSMMGGMPPGAPPVAEGQGQEVDKIDTMEKRLKNVEDQSKLILQKLDLLMDEVDHTKVGSDKNKTLLWAMRQLAKES